MSMGPQATFLAERLEEAEADAERLANALRVIDRAVRTEEEDAWDNAYDALAAHEARKATT